MGLHRAAFGWEDLGRLAGLSVSWPNARDISPQTSSNESGRRRIFEVRGCGFEAGFECGFGVVAGSGAGGWESAGTRGSVGDGSEERGTSGLLEGAGTSEGASDLRRRLERCHRATKSPIFEREFPVVELAPLVFDAAPAFPSVFSSVSPGALSALVTFVSSASCCRSSSAGEPLSSVVSADPCDSSGQGTGLSGEYAVDELIVGDSGSVAASGDDGGVKGANAASSVESLSGVLDGFTPSDG